MCFSRGNRKCLARAYPNLLARGAEMNTNGKGRMVKDFARKPKKTRKQAPCRPGSLYEQYSGSISDIRRWDRGSISVLYVYYTYGIRRLYVQYTYKIRKDGRGMYAIGKDHRLKRSMLNGQERCKSGRYRTDCEAERRRSIVIDFKFTICLINIIYQ